MVIGPRSAVVLIILLLLSGCSLFDGSGGGDGRNVDPREEIFVVHSLAETISSVALNGDGSFGTVQADVQYLGAVPNHLLRLGNELLVTLSGQNELLLLEESTLQVTGRINHGAGNNPMETVHLRPESGTKSLAEGLIATTQLFTDRVRIDDSRERSWSSGSPWTFAVDQAPQALLALPGGSASEIDLLVANTAFSTSSPGPSPFGAATLTVMTIEITSSGSGGNIQQSIGSPVDLEPSGFDPNSDSGTNPTAILDAPDLGQLLVIGSGVNYGSGGTGEDDGSLVVIDRGSLGVIQRIEIGGSPGSGLLLAEGSGYRLYLAGPSGIRSIFHDGANWNSSSRLEYNAAGNGGSLPFIADIASAANTLYAADFANSRILAFTVGADGSLSIRDSVSVSQGPIAMIVDSE
jgi:hypothetical protein